MLVAGSDRNARAWALFHPPLAPLVVLVGILGVIHDSWPASLPHRGNLHVLFGVLLLACVVARVSMDACIRPPGWCSPTYGRFRATWRAWCTCCSTY
jgi:hypothetical protein